MIAVTWGSNNRGGPRAGAVAARAIPPPVDVSDRHRPCAGGDTVGAAVPPASGFRHEAVPVDAVGSPRARRSAALPQPRRRPARRLGPHRSPGLTRFSPAEIGVASTLESCGANFGPLSGALASAHGTLHGRTPGRPGRTQERGPPRGEPAGGRAPARQGQADRPGAHRVPARRGLVPGARHAGPAPGPRHGARGQPALHRRRGDRLRHHRRAPGLPLQPGLHRLRRRARARSSPRRSTR